MADEGDFPTTDDNLAASTKRLADWTFSLQGVGADLKALVNEFKTYWRSAKPSMAMVEDRLISEIKSTPAAVTLRQGGQRQSIRLSLPKASGELTLILVLFVMLVVSITVNGLNYARNERNEEMLRKTITDAAEIKAKASEDLADAKRKYATELELRRYNLDWFRSHEFAEQEVRIGVLERLKSRR